MGMIRIYRCSCGYERQLLVGPSRNSINFNMVLRTLPENLRESFLNERTGNFSLDTVVICCKQCKTLENVLCLKYEALEGEKTKVFPCPNCSTVTNRFEDAEQMYCPNCCEIMTYQDFGHWD